MSTSNNRQLSYTALKEIVPLLPFTVRTSLSIRSSWIKTICDGIERPIELVKFHQKYGAPLNIPDTHNFAAYGFVGVEFAPVYSGVLTVDTTTWNFEYDELSQQVRVTCSLYPGREMFSSQKTLAKELFSSFMEFGVEQLELEETADPFEYIEYFDCPRLRWKINGLLQKEWLYRIDYHTFDVLELVDTRKFQWIFFFEHMRTTKHLIWTDEDYPTRDHVLTMSFFQPFPQRIRNPNKIIHINWKRPLHHSTFSKLCKAMINFNWKIGSFVELLYQKTRRVKRRVWTKLSAQIPNIRRVRLPDKVVSVLKVTDDYVVYVEMFVEDVLRFKASKVAREDCRLDFVAFPAPEQ